MLFDLLDPKEGDLIGALPQGFDAWSTEHQLILRCGLDGHYGETRLYAWNSKLVGATRSSIMEDFVPVSMREPARLRRDGLDTHLILSLVDGRVVEIPVMLADRDRIAALLEHAPGIIPPPQPKPAPKPKPPAPSPVDKREQVEAAAAKSEAPPAKQERPEQPEEEQPPETEQEDRPKPSEQLQEDSELQDGKRAKLARKMLEKLAKSREAFDFSKPASNSKANAPHTITLPKEAILRIGPTRLKRWEGYRDDENIEALHIGGNDQVLIGTCASSTALVWSLETGEVVRQLGPGVGDIKHSALAPDGYTLVVAHAHGEVVLWDIGTGIDKLHLDINAEVSALTITRDGEALILGHKNGSLSAWGLQGGEPLGRIQIDKDPILAIAANSIEQILAAPNDGDLVSCHLESGEHHRILRARDQILSLDLAENGALLIRGRERIALFDIKARVMIWDFEQRNSRAATFGSDPNTLIVVNRQGRICIHDVSAQMIVHTISPKAQPNALAISEDGKTVAVARYRVELFKLPHGDAFLAEPGHFAAITRVHISPHDDELATSSSDGSVLGWSTEHGKLAWELRDGLLGVISPDEHWLAAARQEGVALWSNAENKEIGLLEGLHGGARDLLFSPDATYLAAQYWSAPLQVWDIKRSRIHMECNTQSRVRAMAFSDDSAMLATSDSEGEVIVWSVDGRGELLSFTTTTTAAGLAFSPDNNMLATVETRGQVTLWDLGGASPLYQWELYSENPRSVAISPDGRLMALGCFDGTLLLIDLDSGKERYRATAHQGLITSLDFNVSGKRLATAGVDMNAILWDVGGLPGSDGE